MWWRVFQRLQQCIAPLAAGESSTKPTRVILSLNCGDHSQLSVSRIESNNCWTKSATGRRPFWRHYQYNTVGWVCLVRGPRYSYTTQYSRVLGVLDNWRQHSPDPDIQQSEIRSSRLRHWSINCTSFCNNDNQHEYSDYGTIICITKVSWSKRTPVWCISRMCYVYQVPACLKLSPGNSKCLNSDW